MSLNVSSYSNSSFQVMDAAGVIVLNADPLEKVAKIGHKTLDLVATFIAIDEPFKLLAGHFKGGVAFLETVQFFGKIRELVCPDANGNNFFAVNTWQKCVEKVLMAVHSILKCTRTLSAQGVVKLGKIAATVAGRLTIFSLVTDIFFITSSSFTVWDSVKQGIKARKDLTKADLKIKKWEGRQIHQQESSEQAKVAFKLKKWRVVESNAILVRNKMDIAAVHCLGMISVVSIGILLSATNCVAAFAVRSWLAAGIATDSLGITRFLYDYYNKPLTLPELN